VNPRLIRGVYLATLAVYALGMATSLAALGWLLWKAIHAPAGGDIGLLQIWDGFLTIVREIGKAWRGQ
jgi:hypothetical protein